MFLSLWSVSNPVPFEHSCVWVLGSNVLIVLLLCNGNLFASKKSKTKSYLLQVNSQHNRWACEKNEKSNSHHIDSEQDVHTSSENNGESGYSLD